MSVPGRVIFWRSLSLEASWHAERMQGLGFLFALLPQLRRQEDLGLALARHSGYFSTNVASVGAILGAVAKLESEGRGAEACRIRDLLAAPLSGQADLFFWSALRPFAMALGLAGVLAAQPVLAMILALLVFNLPLWQLRWAGLAHGARAGANLVGKLEAVRPSKVWARRLRRGSSILAGGLLVWGLVQGWRTVGSAAAFHVGAAVVVGYYANRRALSPGITFLILVALSAVVQRLATAANWLQ